MMKDRLWNLPYPQVCVFCERVCRTPICSRCSERIIVVEEPRCKICGKPLDQSEREGCGDCEAEEKEFECGRSLWIHEGGVSESLYRFKYHYRRVNGRFYASQLEQYYGDQIRQWRIEQIIPIPLHWKRRLQRGYNQAEDVANY